MTDLPDLVRLDQPASPGRTRDLGNLLAETVRALNHATRDPGALEIPADADRLLGDVTTALDCLPQLLDQVRHFLHVRAFTGRVGHDQGHDAARSVDVAERALNRASGHLIHAAGMLREATSETSHLTGLGLQEREDDGSA